MINHTPSSISSSLTFTPTLIIIIVCPFLNPSFIIIPSQYFFRHKFSEQKATRIRKPPKGSPLYPPNAQTHKRHERMKRENAKDHKAEKRYQKPEQTSKQTQKQNGRRRGKRGSQLATRAGRSDAEKLNMSTTRHAASPSTSKALLKSNPLLSASSSYYYSSPASRPPSTPAPSPSSPFWSGLTNAYSCAASLQARHQPRSLPV